MRGETHVERMEARPESDMSVMYGPSSEADTGSELRSAIVVPLILPQSVPWRELTSGEGVPPHVTIIFPFMPAADVGERAFGDIAQIAAATTPFAVRLAEMARFPYVLYVRPEPEKPFLALIDTFVTHYPEYPPYGGLYSDVIPHLTIAQGEPDILDVAQGDVEPLLPVGADARELMLLEEVEPAGKRWRAVARFPFRGGNP
jgi:2'-5' RNA ligase